MFTTLESNIKNAFEFFVLLSKKVFAILCNQKNDGMVRKYIRLKLHLRGKK